MMQRVHRDIVPNIITCKGEGAIVHDGWKASFGYRPDFVDLFRTYPAPKKVPNYAGKEVWKLYNLNEGFNEQVDLSSKMPAMLQELMKIFDKESKKIRPIL